MEDIDLRFAIFFALVTGVSLFFGVGNVLILIVILIVFLKNYKEHRWVGYKHEYFSLR